MSCEIGSRLHSCLIRWYTLMKFCPPGRHETTETFRLTLKLDHLLDSLCANINTRRLVQSSAGKRQVSYLGSSHPIWPMMPSIHMRFSRTTEKNCTLSVTEVTWTRLASQEVSSSFHASITSCSFTIMASAFSPA